MGEQQGTFGVSARTGRGARRKQRPGQAVRKYGARHGTIRLSSSGWGRDVVRAGRF